MHESTFYSVANYAIGMNKKILALYTRFHVIGKRITKFCALNVLYVTGAARSWEAQDWTTDGQIRVGAYLGGE